MSTQRTICVVTGSRADYGHLQPVMRAIEDDAQLDLNVVVCGEHLDARFGETWKVIAADGFDIAAKVDIELAEDTALATAQATGRAVSGLAAAFDSLKPDIVLILGDRFEILAAGVAATLLNIPLAHIHGGEVTEAAMDDAMRHALTKMAALHFTAAEPYAARVRQMGEDPACVFMTGAPGLDHLTTLNFMSREELARDLGVDLSGRLFVVTYHPVTLEEDNGATATGELVKALAEFENSSVIFTGVNSDPGHAAIRETLELFARAAPERRTLVQSLGQRRYLSAVKLADAVIGNSSSGLIEAPALGTVTINVGDRQKGRLRSASVIDCLPNSNAIRTAITRALDPTFHDEIKGQFPAYGRGRAADKIVSVLRTVSLESLRRKHFFDIAVSGTPQMKA